MTDSYREQRPLLCDDYSDEEFDVKNYKYQRRKRPSFSSGRARNYAKGATAIITNWPDNCTSSVAYWWLGVSMIAIVIFVIYNSVLIFGMIPTPDMKEPKYRIFNNELRPKTQAFPKSEVYMHLITNNESHVFLNKYMRYASAVTKKYPSFKYNFLILLNDTAKNFPDYKDNERNDMALNSLWSNEQSNKKISNKYNILIEYSSVSTYLNNSPIKKYWRHLPPHLIEFLVRSVSIWEKGGIAFNPNILIPNLYNHRYVDKLYDIFNAYVNSSNKFTEGKIKGKLLTNISTKRPNNIQDIINGLDKDDKISNTDLSVAENNDVDIVSNTENILKFKRDLKHSSEMHNNNKSDLKDTYNRYNNDTYLKQQKNPGIFNSTNSTPVPDNILPLFLKYLFENKPKNVDNISDVIHLKKANTSLFEHSHLNQNQSLSSENILKDPVESDKNNGSTKNFKTFNNMSYIDGSSFLKTNKYDGVPELSMDIKGNIISSKTGCHAFLGTMFSNILRYSEAETVTDFIVSELSLFCNGQLTSCAGVNVILV